MCKEGEMDSKISSQGCAPFREVSDSVFGTLTVPISFTKLFSFAFAQNNKNEKHSIAFRTSPL